MIYDLRARGMALRWWDAIEGNARRGDGFRGFFRRLFHSRIRVARALRAGRARGLRREDVKIFATAAAEARSHARWLSSRVDPAQLGDELRRAERRYRRFTYWGIGLILSPAILLHLPGDGDLIALSMLIPFGAGATLLLGRRSLVLYSALFLVLVGLGADLAFIMAYSGG